MQQLRLELGCRSDGFRWPFTDGPSPQPSPKRRGSTAKGVRGERLRAAFARCPGLARRITFEQAIKCEAVRRCLAVVAEINQRGRGAA